MTSTRTSVDVSARPLTVADAGHLTTVLNQLEAREPADELFTQDETVELLSSPEVNLPVASVGLFDDSELAGFGLLELRRSAELFRANVFGGVADAYLRRGLGTRIVHQLVGAAGRLRDRGAPGVPGELTFWLAQGRVGTAELAAARDFRISRYFFQMTRMLDDLPPRQGPAGFEITPWSAELSAQVRIASNESFADHWGSMPMNSTVWDALFADSVSFRPETSRVALIDGELVGFVLTCEYPAEATARGYRTADIARVGTVRAARGRGIATALLIDTLHALAAQGYRRADLGVDAESPTGAGAIYRRLGFAELRRNSMALRGF